MTTNKNLLRMQNKFKDGNPYLTDPATWESFGYEIPTVESAAEAIRLKRDHGLPCYFTFRGERHFSAATLTGFSQREIDEMDEANDALREQQEEVLPNRLKGVDWLKSRKPLEHLVDGHMPRQGLGQLYGPSYSGKSFVAVDLALSVAAGLSEWMGKPLNVSGPQHVVYVAAEGGQPFWDAVEGWHATHDGADLSKLHVLDGGEGDALYISTDGGVPIEDSLARLTDEINREVGEADVALVVFDPQINILLGVDENSNKDMLDIMTQLKRWADESKLLLVLVHHTGHVGGRSRGASGQFGVMDLVMGLTNNSGLRELKFEKVKGSAQPENPVLFSLADIAISGGSQRSAVIQLRPNGLSQETIDKRASENVDKVILNAVGKGYTSASQIAKALDKSRNDVAARLQVLAAAERVINDGSTTRPVYRLAQP